MVFSTGTVTIKFQQKILEQINMAKEGTLQISVCALVRQQKSKNVLYIVEPLQRCNNVLLHPLQRCNNALYILDPSQIILNSCTRSNSASSVKTWSSIFPIMKRYIWTHEESFNHQFAALWVTLKCQHQLACREVTNYEKILIITPDYRLNCFITHRLASQHHCTLFQTGYTFGALCCETLVSLSKSYLFANWCTSELS